MPLGSLKPAALAPFHIVGFSAGYELTLQSEYLELGWRRAA
jgi:hypothetical protein